MSELVGAPVAIVEQVVWLSAERGDGVGQMSLVRRLRGLVEPQVPRTKERAALDLEQELLVSVLSTALLPSIAAAVLARLDEHRRGAGLSLDDDPWLRASAERYKRRRCRIVQDVLPFVNRALRSCVRYERTRKSTCLPQAVLALESAAEIERAALSPKLAPEEWDAEAGCLGAALSDVLPPFAFRYLVGLVTARLAELSTEPGGLVSTRRESGRDGGEQWLSLDVWADSGNEEGLIDGGWFAPWLEERYQQQLADARQHREEEALRRADAERKMAEWEAHREEERRTETREAEEAPRGNERPLERRTEPVDAPVETKAQIQARADEQRNRELLEQRERDLAKGMLEAEKWRKARQQREEKDDERRREEEEVERKRAAWELKRRAKESPARIQRAGVRVEFGDPRAR